MAESRQAANNFVHITNDVIVPTISVFGLVANLLILLTLGFFKQKRAINIYLGTIAFYDIIILITGVTLNARFIDYDDTCVYVKNRSESQPSLPDLGKEVAPSMVAMLHYLGHFAVIYIQVFISVNRYLNVVHKAKAKIHCTRPRIFCNVLLISFVSILYNVPIPTECCGEVELLLDENKKMPKEFLNYSWVFFGVINPIVKYFLPLIFICSFGVIIAIKLNDGGCSEEDKGLDTDDIHQIFGLPNSTSGEKISKSKRPSKITKTDDVSLKSVHSFVLSTDTNENVLCLITLTVMVFFHIPLMIVCIHEIIMFDNKNALNCARPHVLKVLALTQKAEAESSCQYFRSFGLFVMSLWCSIKIFIYLSTSAMFRSSFCHVVKCCWPWRCLFRRDVFGVSQNPFCSTVDGRGGRKSDLVCSNSTVSEKGKSLSEPSPTVAHDSKCQNNVAAALSITANSTSAAVAVAVAVAVASSHPTSPLSSSSIRGMTTKLRLPFGSNNPVSPNGKPMFPSLPVNAANAAAPATAQPSAAPAVSAASSPPSKAAAAPYSPLNSKAASTPVDPQSEKSDPLKLPPEEFPRVIKTEAMEPADMTLTSGRPLDSVYRGNDGEEEEDEDEEEEEEEEEKSRETGKSEEINEATFGSFPNDVPLDLDDELGTNSNAPVAEPESLESSYILQCSPGRELEDKISEAMEEGGRMRRILTGEDCVHDDDEDGDDDDDDYQEDEEKPEELDVRGPLLGSEKEPEAENDEVKAFRSGLTKSDH